MICLILNARLTQPISRAGYERLVLRIVGCCAPGAEGRGQTRREHTASSFTSLQHILFPSAQSFASLIHSLTLFQHNHAHSMHPPIKQYIQQLLLFDIHNKRQLISICNNGNIYTAGSCTAQRSHAHSMHPPPHSSTAQHRTCTCPIYNAYNNCR